MHEDWYRAPTLTGSIVRLEPLSLDHAEGLARTADDPEIFEHVRGWDVMTPDVAAERIARTRALPHVVPWAQIDLRTGEVAGMTAYHDLDPAWRTVAIGHTWIARRFWRTGLNTEAKLLLLQRAFDVLGCVRVAWHTDVRNSRSQTAIARLGAVREGVLRKHKPRDDGSWRDTVVYSMTDDEWPAARERLAGMLRR